MYRNDILRAKATEIIKTLQLKTTLYAQNSLAFYVL